MDSINKTKTNGGRKFRAWDFDYIGLGCVTRRFIRLWRINVGNISL